MDGRRAGDSPGASRGPGRWSRWLTRHRTGVTAAARRVAGGAGRARRRCWRSRRGPTRELKRANADLAIANAKVTRANTELAAANERERARFDLALEAIRMFHTGVSEDILLKQEEFKALRTKLLRGAREFYRKLGGLLQGQRIATRGWPWAGPISRSASSRGSSTRSRRPRRSSGAPWPCSRPCPARTRPTRSRGARSPGA